MNTIWQVQEAKNRFSELMERAAKNGPQTVTRHGRAVVRVVAVNTPSEPLAVQDDGFAQYLLGMPKVDGFEIAPRRSRKPPASLGD